MKKVYSFILITVFGASVFGQTVPSYVPTNGLVGWWPFNGNANDESGNGNNGTVNGATLTTDRFGNANKAYSFDGVNDFISVPDNSILDLQNNYSIGVWMNFTVIPTNEYTLISKERQLDGTGLAIIIDNTGKIYHSFHNGTLLQTISTYALTNSQWYHVVISYDGTTAKLFLNGVLNISTVFSQNLINTTFNWFIGKEFTTNGGGTSGYTNRYFRGKLDDIGIWNRALTQAEITALYTANGVGIKDQSLNQLSIYPNPAKTQITLNATTNQIGKTLKVYDALGKLVYETILKQQQYNINITHWANGIYTVAIPEQGLTYKFVKE